MDLTQMMDRFLKERLEIRPLDGVRLRQTTRYRLRLIGDTSLLGFPMGFVQFLKAIGVTTPTLRHVDSHYVGRYFEFLMQRNGGVHATAAMRTVRIFWGWCVANEYIKDRPMPADLVGIKSANLYRITVQIKER